ncbi:MAG: HTH-type transcriptional activator Btr [bacterium ADurb.Bin374]|nr:MAG: HTH-type transcriptional activator Btr [bacterium ADurb.Bin374]
MANLLEHPFMRLVFEHRDFSLYRFDGQFRRKTSLTLKSGRIGIFICEKGHFHSDTTTLTHHLHERLVSFALSHDCTKVFDADVEVGFFLVMFDRAVLESFISGVGGDVRVVMGSFSSCQCTVRNTGRDISAAVSKLHAEATGRYWGYATAIEAAFDELLVNFVRMFSEANREQVPADPVTAKVGMFLEAHMDRELSLEEVADWAGVSKNHLCRIFKKSTGQRVFQYLNSLRIRRACERLKGTGETVERIARSVGFNNTNYFHKVFKNVTGTMPTAWRKSAGAAFAPANVEG